MKTVNARDLFDEKTHQKYQSESLKLIDNLSLPMRKKILEIKAYNCIRMLVLEIDGVLMCPFKNHEDKKIALCLKTTILRDEIGTKYNQEVEKEIRKVIEDFENKMDEAFIEAIKKEMDSLADNDENVIPYWEEM